MRNILYYTLVSYTPFPCPMFCPSFLRFSTWRRHVILVFLATFF